MKQQVTYSIHVYTRKFINLWIHRLCQIYGYINLWIASFIDDL